MTDLFTWFSRALAGSDTMALSASACWGCMSVLLSPCHLAGIPLIVAFIHGGGRVPTKRAFLLASIFSAGILVTIGLVGLITGLAGRMIGDIGVWGQWIVIAVFIIFGLHLLGVLKLSFLEQSISPSVKTHGIWTAFGLGLVFGLAVGPCTFAFMAPVLGLAFKVAADRFLFAALLILAYALGHCVIIILAGTFTGSVKKYLAWNERSKGATRMRTFCGLLVLSAGLYFAVKLFL
ncbi:cytochrome C biogenesis protein [bacterium]|nr:cytochrome C biogenesis protein [bacterium]